MSIEFNKAHNHNHFWIENGTVYETYETIRGLRYRVIGEVLYPDTERLTDEDINKIKNITQ